MAIIAQASMPFTATVEGAASGLVGTLAVRIVDIDGATVVGPTTANIIELVAGSGIYEWSAPAAPATLGAYEVVWDAGGPDFAAEDLTVTLSPITTGGAGAPPYPTIGTIRQQAQQAQRTIVGRPFVASFTFGRDGDAVPDTMMLVHVSVVNAEGFLVVDTQAATLGAADTPVTGQQVATFALAASVLPQRDCFTCLWTATIGGHLVTQLSTIDVCDARLFALADYSTVTGLEAKTATELEDGRRDAEDRLERECGCAFTGRYGSEDHILPIRRPGGAVRLVLRRPFVQAIRGIQQTLAGVVTALDLSSAVLDSQTGILYYAPGMRGQITVSYEHGHAEAGAGRAALILARETLLKGPVDQRGVSLNTDQGTITLAVPDGSSPFGLPDVDSFVARHDNHALGLFG